MPASMEEGFVKPELWNVSSKCANRSRSPILSKFRAPIHTKCSSVVRKHIFDMVMEHFHHSRNLLHSSMAAVPMERWMQCQPACICTTLDCTAHVLINFTLLLSVAYLLQEWLAILSQIVQFSSFSEEF